MQIRNNSYLDTFYAVIQTKLPPVRNPKPCLKYKCSLVFDVIDFNCDLKLFKAFNRKYFDVADSLITIPCCINYDGLYKPIAFLLMIIIIFAKKSNNQTVFAYSTSVTAQCLCSFEKKRKGFSQLFFSFFWSFNQNETTMQNWVLRKKTKRSGKKGCSLCSKKTDG